MSGALSELYRDVILDHSRRPRNYRRVDGGATVVEENNPLCGDTLTVYVILKDDVLYDAAFQGVGCALSTASASMMTEAVRGRSPGDVAELAAAFGALVTAGCAPAGAVPKALGAFAGVGAFPSRVNCALLPWRALSRALQLPE